MSMMKVFSFLGELYMPPKSTSGPCHISSKFNSSLLQTSVTTNVTGPAVRQKKPYAEIILIIISLKISDKKMNKYFTRCICLITVR